jgi:hypothetical protein
MTPYYPLEATPGVDPAPNVPTPEEIRQAEVLLHRLESRLLSHLDDRDTPAGNTPSQPPTAP